MLIGSIQLYGPVSILLPANDQHCPKSAIGHVKRKLGDQLRQPGRHLELDPKRRPWTINHCWDRLR